MGDQTSMDKPFSAAILAIRLILVIVLSLIVEICHRKSQIQLIQRLPLRMLSKEIKGAE